MLLFLNPSILKIQVVRGLQIAAIFKNFNPENFPSIIEHLRKLYVFLFLYLLPFALNEFDEYIYLLL